MFPDQNTAPWNLPSCRRIHARGFHPKYRDFLTDLEFHNILQCQAAIFLPGTLIRDVFMENTVEIWTRTSGSNSRPMMRDLSGTKTRKLKKKKKWNRIMEKFSAESPNLLCAHKRRIDDGRPPLSSKNTPLLSDGFLIRFRIPDRLLKPVQVNWPQNSRLVSQAANNCSFHLTRRIAPLKLPFPPSDGRGGGGLLEE